MLKARMFFFEKKNQKTFVLGAWVLERTKPQEQKFFAELSFKKATACLKRIRTWMPAFAGMMIGWGAC
jgi:uncharacterized protein (DUF2062 family)